MICKSILYCLILALFLLPLSVVVNSNIVVGNSEISRASKVAGSRNASLRPKNESPLWSF